MRAKNMQALTDDLKKRFAGVVIYGVGDAAHRLEVSDHNEDDTPGVRAEQSDSDNIPEHRAIDVMLSGAFTANEAAAFVARLLADPSAERRLHYIIWNHSIWSASDGWVHEMYNGDNPHTDHVHISGLASDDDNTASWPAVNAAPPKPAPAAVVLKRGDTGEAVRKVQRFFRDVFPAYRNFVSVRRGVIMVVDGIFGAQTEAWVQEFQRRTGITPDGVIGSSTFNKMREEGFK